LERGLFEPEQGEGQMWGQRNSKYAAAVGTQLLAKIHVLDNKIGLVDHQQNHPIDCLEECLDFIRDTSDQVGKVVDKLNNRIDVQDIQIQKLANMVNDLVGKTEEQYKAIKSLKEGWEEQCKVINWMTAKVIALEQYTKDIQKKVFPKVRRSRATWLFVNCH
jgi:predicted nucleic acid-binding protein